MDEKPENLPDDRPVRPGEPVFWPDRPPATPEPRPRKPSPEAAPAPAADPAPTMGDREILLEIVRLLERLPSPDRIRIARCALVFVGGA